MLSESIAVPPPPPPPKFGRNCPPPCPGCPGPNPPWPCPCPPPGKRGPAPGPPCPGGGGPCRSPPCAFDFIVKVKVAPVKVSAPKDAIAHLLNVIAILHRRAIGVLDERTYSGHL